MRTRNGLRIRGSRGHPEVRGALIRFARRLRMRFEFPIRVPVYLHPGENIFGYLTGKPVSASIWIPDDPSEYPLIRIATGDYEELLRKRGRDDALAAFICSLAHEVVHYRQWIETEHVWERGVARKALNLMREYAKTVDHP